MTYLVHTPQFGTLRKQDDSIAAVRAWARQFPGATVQREGSSVRCDCCDSTPCVVSRRED